MGRNDEHSPYFKSLRRPIGRLSCHHGLRPKVAAILRDLESDPFQSHLKFHHLAGALKGVQEVSVTHIYRITLAVMVTDREIILLDIGSHDGLCRS